MNFHATFIHINLIARDWRKLAAFYLQVLGCTPASPELDLRGEWLERGTGVAGACVQGIHLRLPGFGDTGPILEIFQYIENVDTPPHPANRIGFTHLAFDVEDVGIAYQAALSAGGTALGTVESVNIPGMGRVTWTYVRDPEGNIVELLKKDPDSAKSNQQI